MKIAILEPPREDRPMVAMGLLLFAVTLLAFQDALIKLVAEQTSFWQLQAIRSFFNLLMVACLAVAGSGPGLLVPRRLGPAIARGVMLSLCMACFFGASQQITITQMAAGLYTYPLFVTLLAGPILGERIGPWRLGALLIGAGGCFLVLNPLAQGFTLFQIVPIAAGFFYACNIMILRRYCRNESPLALMLAVSLVLMASGVVGGATVSLAPVPEAWREAVPFVFVGWPQLTAMVLGFFALFALLNLFGNICLSRAYQTADSSWLAPLDFSYLLVSALWGRVLFESWPAPLAWAGMAMIAAAGIITALREHRKPRGATPEGQPG